MAFVLADRVQETSTTSGTGSLTLAGAVTGYQSFSSGIGNGNTTYYSISDGTNWEIGTGTYTSAGNTISRDVVFSSSNGGALVNFTSNTKNVWVDYAAGKAVTTDTLAYPPAIGGTTPAAGTFTTLTANSTFQAGKGSANYIQGVGAATTLEPVISVIGSDTNVPLAIKTQGTGAIDLAPGSSGVNISNGGTVTAITRTAAGASYTSFPSVAITAPTTAGGVQATASVAFMIANTATVQSGGTGYTLNDVVTLSGGTPILAATYTVTGVSGGVVTAVTPLNFGTYSVLPTNPVSVTGGTGTGLTVNVTYSVPNSFTITKAGSGYVEQPTVSFSGGGGSGAAAYASVGGGVTIRSLGSTGTQSIDFATPASSTNTVPVLRLRDVSVGTSNTGFVTIQNNNGYSQVIAQGPTNANLYLASNGTGSINFNTQSTTETNQMRVTHTASAVNYVQVTGAATTANPVVSVAGSDANISMVLTSKGTGNVRTAASFLLQSGTSIPAGGTAGAGLLMSSTSNFGVFFGSGAPTLSAAKGSLYLRSDGSSTSTRLYVNTDGATTWTNVTTAA